MLGPSKKKRFSRSKLTLALGIAALVPTLVGVFIALYRWIIHASERDLLAVLVIIAIVVAVIVIIRNWLLPWLKDEEEDNSAQ